MNEFSANLKLNKHRRNQENTTASYGKKVLFMQKMENTAFKRITLGKVGNFFNNDPKGKSKTENKTTDSGAFGRRSLFLERSLKYNPISKDIVEAGSNPFQLMRERLNTDEITEAVNGSGLKVRLFVASHACENWDDRERVTGQFFSSLFSVDFYCEPHPEVVYLLQNSKFIGYASVVIIVHNISLLIGILEAMEQNRYLRYKSKFILCRHERDFSNSTSLLHKFSPKQSQDKYGTIKSTVSQAEEFIRGTSAISVTIGSPKVTVGGVDNNNNNFRSRQIENVLLLHWMEDDNFSARYGYACVLYAVLLQPHAPLKKTLKETFKLLIATPNADLYCYSINPALAIIINNYYFTNPHTIREGSEQDVIHLIRELKIAAIPYILIEDCNEEELSEILDYVENKDFRPLKSFLFFLMSHGGADDVIYTHDGRLNIKEDIVKRIQANKSLENTKNLLAIVACRGPIDMEYADEDDLERIQPTDSSHLNKNTMVMYSVPNQIQSIRSPQTGCPFIQSFCHHFRLIGHTDDVRVLEERINDDLKRMDYFDGLDKCSELIARDAHQSHYIIQMPVQALEMLKLLNSIANDFPIRECNSPPFVEGRGSSYVCGVLNATRFEKDGSIRQYFADELEWDTFSLIGDPSDLM